MWACGHAYSWAWLTALGARRLARDAIAEAFQTAGTPHLCTELRERYTTGTAEALRLVSIATSTCGPSTRSRDLHLYLHLY